MMTGWVRGIKRGLAPLIAGLIAGGALTGVALAQFDVAHNCAVKDLRFFFDGVDRTPWQGTLPEGNPVGFICNGRTYVPLRWLSESLGKRVDWDGSTWTISVSGAEWNIAGISLGPSRVQTGSGSTTVTMTASNTTDERRSFTFAVDFYDGTGHLIGTARGTEAATELAAGERREVTATSTEGFSGYAYLSARADVTPAGLYPRGTRTEVPEVNRVIDAVMAKDAATLNGLLEMERTTCTTQPSGSDPRPVCPDGTPDGTVIDVFPVAHCQPFYLYSADQARQSLDDAVFSRPLWVYSVYRLPQSSGGSSGYVIMLASSTRDKNAPVIYVDDHGAIISLHTTCNDPATDVPNQGVTFILPPQT